MNATTAIVRELTAIAESATRQANVEIEGLSGDHFYVTVESDGHRQDRLTGDGDHCQGQNWILGEAYAVLSALEDAGWRHIEFGGRKSMNHSGGGCGFAISR